MLDHAVSVLNQLKLQNEDMKLNCFIYSFTKQDNCQRPLVIADSHCEPQMNIHLMSVIYLTRG